MSKLAQSNEDTMAEIEARRLMEHPHDMEAEANAFAMELLMPEKFMREDLAKMGGIDIEEEPKIDKLEKRYMVSRQVMTIRIGQLIGVL